MSARRFDHVRRIDELIGVNDDVLVLTPRLFDFSHCAHIFSFISGQKAFQSLHMLILHNNIVVLGA